MRLLSRSIFVAVLFFGFSSLALAQGGKAEPNRISFKPGATSGTVKGTIKNSEEAEYVFGAREGQRITITLTSTPAKSATFDLLDPNQININEGTEGFTWSEIATATGDYMITVSRLVGKGTKSNYTLTITIK